MVIWKEGNVLFNDTLNTFYLLLYGERERNVLFNNALNTFYLPLYGVRHMVEHHSDSERKEGNVSFNDTLNTFYLRLYGEREREMFYLTTHSTHFIYGYMGRER